MSIQNNMMAVSATRYYNMAINNMSVCMQRLSSGYRINSASDDAAGLCISEKMRSQIRGLETASRNVQDGISLLQIADGGLNEVHSILQRVRELSVQSANDTNTGIDRIDIQVEVDELIKEINRIADQTEFNTKKLLNGDCAGTGDGNPGIRLQVGANEGQAIGIGIGSVKSNVLGIDSLKVTSYTEASDAITKTESAITKVSEIRGRVGAYQNRLEHIVNSLDNTAENLQAAESRIRDINMADAIMEYIKNQIISQAAQAMLAQANKSAEGILKLLQ